MIGAGNTAIDMAVQIARLGCEDVTVVYRRGVESMSATHHEQEIAKANQVRIKTWAKPVQVLLDDAGRVRGMRFENMRNLAGERFELAADAIFKAIGQTLDVEQTDVDKTGLAFAADKIAVDANFRTNLKGVYAGGDCIGPGQDLTVQAVQHGKLAARAIHADLFALANEGVKINKLAEA